MMKTFYATLASSLEADEPTLGPHLTQLAQELWERTFLDLAYKPHPDCGRSHRTGHFAWAATKIIASLARLVAALSSNGGMRCDATECNLAGSR